MTTTTRSALGLILATPGGNQRDEGGGAEKERPLAGGGWQSIGLVFASTIGTPLDDRNVRRAFRDVLAPAGLPQMRIHDLRHPCATLLLAQGVHPKAVQSILGHSQISLTMDTYSTLLPAVSRDAADQMDKVLRA